MLSAREIKALIVAPLVTPIGYWLGQLAVAVARAMDATSEQRFPGVAELVRSLGLILAFGAPVAWIVTFAMALPAYIALRSAARRRIAFRRWRSPLTVALGASLGVLAALVLRPSLSGDLISVSLPPWSGALLGAASAALFVRLAGEGPGGADSPPVA